MITLFAGDDSTKKLSSYEAFIEGIPDAAAAFSVNKSNFNPVEIEGFCSGASLFAAKVTVVFQDILETEEARDFILLRLALMGESENLFVFLERKLNKPVLDAFKKAGAELFAFELPKDPSTRLRAGKEKFNTFVIANSFAARDKFYTWLYFRQAVERGVALEELAGILFWKVKDMILKGPPERPGSSGRAGNYSKWKAEELKEHAARVACLLPEARTRGPEAESAFEQFLLEAF